MILVGHGKGEGVGDVCRNLNHCRLTVPKLLGGGVGWGVGGTECIPPSPCLVSLGLVTLHKAVYFVHECYAGVCMNVMQVHTVSRFLVYYTILKVSS